MMETTNTTDRDVAIDVLRGLAVAIMIIVDAVPDLYTAPQILVHSPWEGITVADLAFPAFVFSMGVSMPFSRMFHNDSDKIQRAAKIIRRSCLLFILGIIFNMLPDIFNLLLTDGYTTSTFWEQVRHGRLFGVLQRLALAYALGLMLIITLKEPRRIIVAAFFLLLLSSFGYRIYSPDNPFDKINNISVATDNFFPGFNHVYLAYGFPFDPEGLYGTINAVASVLFGAVAGNILRGNKVLPKIFCGKCATLFAGGVVLLFAAVIWNDFDPTVKALWTSPYALYNAGFDAMALSLILFGAEVCPPCRRLFSPLVNFGINPLFFFIASNFCLVFLFKLPGDGVYGLYHTFYWNNFLPLINDNAVGASLYALLWCCLWTIPAEILRRKNIIIKL